jgi:hypothetical protein
VQIPSQAAEFHRAETVPDKDSAPPHAQPLAESSEAAMRARAVSSSGLDAKAASLGLLQYRRAAAVGTAASKAAHSSLPSDLRASRAGRPELQPPLGVARKSLETLSIPRIRPPEPLDHLPASERRERSNKLLLKSEALMTSKVAERRR